MKRIFNKLLKKKDEYTIDFIENKIGTKLTYPIQFIGGNSDDDKYKELLRFGCSDISSNGGYYLHRDCGLKNCSKCNFYPIVEKYYIENNIDRNERSETFIIPVDNLSIEEVENQIKQILNEYAKNIK
ncbi:hypothetical protein M0Q97_13035 [Candidatus Dojkabacteria bacterium]|jgi:hypothetical protein|nr:hypothetical protein [Candidatus Dojkabacteria bacterium]